jgi:hypothetical protein
MCTVSWLAQPNGYMLFCNRDERHTRLPALPPSIRVQHGVPIIAPTDGEAGGTWIGVNAYGLSLCLLNRYPVPPGVPAAAAPSRGLLVHALLDCATQEEAVIRLSSWAYTALQPFTLLLLQPAAMAMVVEWTGEYLGIDKGADLRMPLISSSYNPFGVQAMRRALLRSMVQQAGMLDADLLERYHRSHEPMIGPYAVCMHRDDAATVSLSIITVAASRVSFVYHPDAPCAGAAAHVLDLERSTTPKSLDLREAVSP